MLPIPARLPCFLSDFPSKRRGALGAGAWRWALAVGPASAFVQKTLEACEEAISQASPPRRPGWDPLEPSSVRGREAGGVAGRRLASARVGVRQMFSAFSLDAAPFPPLSLAKRVQE